MLSSFPSFVGSRITMPALSLCSPRKRLNLSSRSSIDLISGFTKRPDLFVSIFCLSILIPIKVISSFNPVRVSRSSKKLDRFVSAHPTKHPFPLLMWDALISSFHKRPFLFLKSSRRSFHAFHFQPWIITPTLAKKGHSHQISTSRHQSDNRDHLIRRRISYAY